MAGIIVNGVVAIGFCAPLAIKSNQPAFVSDSLNLAQYVARQKAQRWEITTGLMPSNDSSDYLCHSTKHGFDIPFDIEMPQVRRAVQVTSASKAEINTNAIAGAQTVSAQITGRIQAGEFIQFENHTKVYLLMNDVSSTSVLEIQPPLRRPMPVGTKIFVGKQVKMRCRYELATSLGITYTDGILSDPGSVTLVEAI